MKYIRTKDGVVEFNIIRKLNETTYEIEGIKDHYVHKEEIIAQADTIEKLCDEFVLVNSEHIWNNLIFTVLDDLYEEYNKSQYIKWEVYGAIWTDKGLIYVAKMNEKGELELL